MHCVISLSLTPGLSRGLIRVELYDISKATFIKVIHTHACSHALTAHLMRKRERGTGKEKIFLGRILDHMMCIPFPLSCKSRIAKELLITILLPSPAEGGVTDIFPHPKTLAFVTSLLSPFPHSFPFFIPLFSLSSRFSPLPTILGT